MAPENIEVNISLTGAQAAVEQIRAYIDELAKASEVQVETGKTAKSAADGISTLAAASDKAAKSAGSNAKAMGDQAKAMGGLAAEADRAAAGNDALALAEERAVAPTRAQTIALENQTRALQLQITAAEEAMAKNQRFAENFATNAPKLTRTALYVTAGVAGLAYEGIKQYMSFNQKMTQTFTQAGVAFGKQKALTQDMANIAKNTGRNFNDVADALYRVASATAGMNQGKGATTQQLSNLVQQTQNLAVLGNLAPGAQSEQAARIMGSVANAGIGGRSSKGIAAQVNAIVGAGDIRMSELITALGRGVLTSGKTVGLNLKQVGAYIDLLTSRGTTGASAGTYVAHAFQLLAGSTAQAANWQNAIGLQGGEMINTMKHQGLNAAVQLLYAHMQKLDATPSNIKMMQKAGLSDAEISAWSAGLQPGSDMQTAVMQRAMTAMFGGGRQAMPLMTLLQSAGIDTSNLTKGFKGADLGKGATYQEILDSINRNSTQSRYKKDLTVAMNTPAVQEQKLLRSLQWDLIQFGKTMTPIWMEFLRGATSVVKFLGKFKLYLVEIGVVIGGILALAAGKQIGKLLLAARDTAGGAKYWGQRFSGATSLKEGSWADKYASKRGLKYSSAAVAAEAQIAVAKEQLAAQVALLRVVEGRTAFSPLLPGQSKGLAGSIHRGEQMLSQYPWAAGEENLLPHRRYGRNGRWDTTMAMRDAVSNDPYAAINRRMTSYRSTSSGILVRDAEKIAKADAIKAAERSAVGGAGSGLLSKIGGMVGGLFGMGGGGATAGVAGAAESAVGGGLLKGALGGALGIAGGPWGMAAMTLGPILAPTLLKFGTSAVKSIGGMLGNIFGSHNLSAAPAMIAGVSGPSAIPTTTPGGTNPPVRIGAAAMYKLTNQLNAQAQKALKQGDIARHNQLEAEALSAFYTGNTLNTGTPSQRNAASAAYTKKKQIEDLAYLEKLQHRIVKGKNGAIMGFMGADGMTHATQMVDGKAISPNDLQSTMWKLKTAINPGSPNDPNYKKFLELQGLSERKWISPGKYEDVFRAQGPGNPTVKGVWVGSGANKQWVTPQSMGYDPSSSNGLDLSNKIFGKKFYGSGMITSAGARGQGDVAIVNSIGAMLKSTTKGKETAEGRANVETALAQAAIDTKNAAKETKSSQAAAAAGNFKAASAHQKAAAVLEQDAGKLTDAAKIMRDKMNLADASASRIGNEVGKAMKAQGMTGKDIGTALAASMGPVIALAAKSAAGGK